MRENQQNSTSTGRPLVEVKLYELGYGYLARVVWRLVVFSGDDAWRYIRQPVHIEFIKEDTEGEIQCK